MAASKQRPEASAHSHDSLRDRVAKVAPALSGVADGLQYARHFVRGHKIASRMPSGNDPRPPVVLVHGFLGTRGTMAPLTDRFVGSGRTVFSHAHGNFNTAALQNSAKELVRQLRCISQDFGGERVDLVGFSFGGLLSTYALQSMGAGRYVRSLAMLGTPLRGSWLSLPGAAVMGAFSSAVWQLLPSSPILRQLRSRPLPSDIRVAQIFASHDRFCPEPGRLSCVREQDYITAPGGHASLIMAPHFFRILQGFHERVEQDHQARRPTQPHAAAP